MYEPGHREEPVGFAMGPNTQTVASSNVNARNAITLWTTSEVEHCPGPVTAGGSGGDKVWGCVNPHDATFTALAARRDSRCHTSLRRRSTAHSRR